MSELIDLIYPRELEIKDMTESNAFASYLDCYLCIDNGKPGLPQSKYLENEFFSRSGKSQGIFWMVREFYKGLGKSGNLEINGYGRQTSENLFSLFKRGKSVLSHEIV